MLSKKTISPVVATALLLVVAVVAVIGFQGWFQSYSSIMFSDVEIRSSSNEELRIETLIGNTLYIKSGSENNVTLSKLSIGGVECTIDKNLSLGMNELNVSSCLNSVTISSPEIILFSEGEIIKKQVYLKNYILNPIISNSEIIGNLFHVLDNPNNYSTSVDDHFSFSVSISGNYAIVGAVLEDDIGGIQSGKAYIFNVISGNLLHVLDNPNNYSTSVEDHFGGSASIDGNYAIVGADYEDDASGISSGKAYIFDVVSGNLLHVLNNPNNYSTSEWDVFGGSVSISSNYAIVGAHQEDDIGGIQSGKAYIFNVINGNLLHVLDNPNNYSTSQNDRFGFSVSISGNYAIVGAYAEGEVGNIASGKAYIFDVVSGDLLHVLDNPNNYSTSDSDRFGESVSISGNYAIIGANSEDDPSGFSSGKAYIFDVVTGNLLHVLDNPNNYSTSDSDYFGASVSIDENYAIVGAYAEDDANGSNSGKAYIFDVVTGNLLHVLDNPNNYSTGDSDVFGYKVSISGNYAIVGVSQEDDIGGIQSGKAYIFK